MPELPSSFTIYGFIVIIKTRTDSWQKTGNDTPIAEKYITVILSAVQAVKRTALTAKDKILRFNHCK